MNTKFLIAGFAGFIVSLATGFVAHGMLLQADYAAIPTLMRTEADAMAHFPYMLLSHFFKGFAFAWIYRQGISSGASWLSQGVRFGIAVALLMTVPLYLIYYAVQPMPGMLVVKQIVADSISTVLMGVVVAFICKPAASEA
jgi:membrane protease YdiL (CAAX protease family)